MDDNKALRLLGMALRAGRLEVGSDPAAALVASGRAKLAVVAHDAADRVKAHLSSAAEETNARYIEAPFGKSELGTALGRAECAAVATGDTGFSKAIVKALEQNTEVTSI